MSRVNSDQIILSLIYLQKCLSSPDRLTGNGDYELAVEMMDSQGTYRRADYSTFTVGNEASGYVLNIGGYSTEPQWAVGDDFSSHDGYKFSTFDQDNGATQRRGNGGGWFGSMPPLVDPFGINHNDTASENRGTGIMWKSFLGSTNSLMRFSLSIRPKNESPLNAGTFVADMQSATGVSFGSIVQFKCPLGQSVTTPSSQSEVYDLYCSWNSTAATPPVMPTDCECA